MTLIARTTGRNYVIEEASYFLSSTSGIQNSNWILPNLYLLL